MSSDAWGSAAAFTSSALGSDGVQVLEVDGGERIGHLYELRVRFSHRKGPLTAAELDALCLQPCSLTIGDGQAINGIARSVETLSATGAKAIYDVFLVPTLWLLSVSKLSRLYQKMDVKGMAADVLGRYGLMAFADLRLDGAVPRDFAVQYQESDWDYLQRWFEHEGYFYWFEHSSSGEKLVVADDNSKTTPISGNSTTANLWADKPEVYDPTANTWTALSKVSTSEIHEEEYPFSYLLPSGEVFTIGPSEDVSYELNVANQTWTATGGASGITNGSSVMYRPGKILYSGGAPSVIKVTNASASAATIDLTAATPKWRQIAPMHYARVYHTLTMLANGEVLAIGGEPTSDQSIVTSGVLPTEIWNPATETWRAAAPIAAARNYHSTAMLLPNGKVLLAGGGHYNALSDPGEFSAQTYSPPYLFDGPRPTITSAPAASTYGTSVNVVTPEASSIA